MALRAVRLPLEPSRLVREVDRQGIERRYTIILDPDPETGVYVVTVPALPGCFTQGATVEQATERAKEAIRCHLAPFGRPTGRPVGVRR